MNKFEAEIKSTLHVVKLELKISILGTWSTATMICHIDASIYTH